MGGGGYSYSSRMTRATASGMTTNSLEKNFKSRSVQKEMKSVGVTVRESRDSDEHPESMAIIVALDTTGSMGGVPDHLVKYGFPEMMKGILEDGCEHPQVLFMGIGDHIYDSAPLQVGQFESSDELLDKWLTQTWLEKGGGMNDGESYMLAWFFAARHTSIDCLEKRGEKGFLFTIGDEHVLSEISGDSLKQIMGGEGQSGGSISSADLLKEAQEKYHVYHIHVAETGSGKRTEVQNRWKEMLGDNAIIVQSSDHVSGIIASIVGGKATPDSQTDGAEPSEDKPEEIL